MKIKYEIKMGYLMPETGLDAELCYSGTRGLLF